jgi:hypothetical protein
LGGALIRGRAMTPAGRLIAALRVLALFVILALLLGLVGLALFEIVTHTEFGW